MDATDQTTTCLAQAIAAQDAERAAIPTCQLVVRDPESNYTVRTYEARGDRWVRVSEVPANYRDIVQATLDGNVAYQEESLQ